MADQHPMTPPTELLTQWENDWFNEREHADVLLVNAYAAGAQAGADQELEACCHEVQNMYSGGSRLLAARRPKPPSLKEQALAVLEDAFNRLDAAHENIIRRALEALPDEP